MYGLGWLEDFTTHILLTGTATLRKGRGHIKQKAAVTEESLSENVLCFLIFLEFSTFVSATKYYM